MPAFSDELAEERPAVTADVPFRGGRHQMGFRCPYYDFDQHLLASSPPGYGYELWRETGKSDLHASRHHSYDCSCQAFDRSSEDNSSTGQKTKQRCVSIQHTDSSFADVVDATSSQFSESVSLNTIKTEDVHSAHTHHRRHGRVKRVSFADDFGHRLAEVKYFCDRAPTPSRSAHVEAAVLLPDFPMPISVHEVFSEKMDRLRVSLESLSVSTSRAALRGIVRVKNLAFEKRVFVRYSFDAWKTSTDVACRYRPAFYPGAIGKSHDWFSFTLTVPPDDFGSGSAEFAVCFQCDGKEYWDNNFGANYRLVSPNRRASDVDDDKRIS